jgi:hypothetical protein
MLRTAPVYFAQSVHRPVRPVRFGNSSNADGQPMSEARLREISQELGIALEQLQSMPGADNQHQSPLAQFFESMLTGNASLAQVLIDTLKGLQRTSLAQHGIQTETYTRNNGAPGFGTRVKVGAFEQLFKETNLDAAGTCSFEQFLIKKFGDRQRVIISLTGWTKPPVEPLLKSPIYGPMMKDKPPEMQAKIAEQAYVDVIKEFLDDVTDSIRQELPHFDPRHDLGIIYGVTPEGVDRAVLEFSQKAGVPIVGLTCYDWSSYIPDEASQPDVYIAENPKQFNQLMTDASNKVVVTGGRRFAAHQNKDGTPALGYDRRIPADLINSYMGIQVPSVVPDEDGSSGRVLNAAALAKALMREVGLDLWDSKPIQDAKNGRTTDNEDVFITTHILKRELEGLYRARALRKKMDAQSDD